MQFAIALLLGGLGASVCAEHPPPDRWAALAAAHEPKACLRCSPPPAVSGSVAEVLRRMRHESGPSAAASVASFDVVADLRHVAATAPDDQDRLAMRIAEDRARNDVGAAANFAAALPAGRVQNGAMLVVIHRWVYHDPRSALAWAQALPDEGTRRVAVSEVTRHLVAADPRAAIALVAGLPEGPGRDDALCAVVRYWAKIDRSAALAWARSLADRVVKARALEAVVEHR